MGEIINIARSCQYATKPSGPFLVLMNCVYQKKKYIYFILYFNASNCQNLDSFVWNYGYSKILIHLNLI